MVDGLSPPPPLADLLARGALALFLDFDGTLIDIAPRPDAIRVPGSLSARLRSLSERLDGRLALISGRSIEDLERHCGSLPMALAGSHGADLRPTGRPSDPTSVAGLPHFVVSEVEQFAAREALVFEGKPHGAALHSRELAEKEDMALLFMESLAQRHGLMVKRGKFVAELVRPGAHKGAAVAALMQQPPFAGAAPVFVGDDVTDEDGFAAAIERGGFGVAVGERRSERAAYRLSDPAAVHDWLNL